jgi:hypothetical protein
MTATTSSPAAAATSATSETAPWTAFGKFALVFGIAFVITYMVCCFKGWPLFSYHPATGRFAWGYELAIRGGGPVMYWYGWVAICLIVGTIAGLLGTLLPNSVAQRIPLALAWLLPALAFPLMFYSVLPLLTHAP